MKKAAVYCGTSNLYEDMTTAAKSLAINSSVDEIYFLIEDSVFPYKLPSYIHCIDVSGQTFFSQDGPNFQTKWTYMTMMRVALPKIFPGYDRILSLDIDTIVDQNIDKLWELDLEGYYLAGAKEAIKSKQDAPYINNGVAMYNLKALREDRIDEQLITLLNTKKYQFCEQDCINEVCRGKILTFSSDYNSNRWTGAAKNPRIYHFAAEHPYSNNPAWKKYSGIPWHSIRKDPAKIRYMIHSSPARQWYVDEFLIPSMQQQGINENEIIVRCDTAGRGNLNSCMDAFLWCGQNMNTGTWHLQDDVIISSDFAEKTRKHDDGIVCGFVSQDWGPHYDKTGLQPAEEFWYSFQCIRIPDQIAGECAEWFYTVAMKSRNPEYRNRINRKNHDDDFFRFFLREKHSDMSIMNLSPNIVDHIDYLIGGTLINKSRKRLINRAAYWADENLVMELQKKLEERNQNGL